MSERTLPQEEVNTTIWSDKGFISNLLWLFIILKFNNRPCIDRSYEFNDILSLEVLLVL